MHIHLRNATNVLNMLVRFENLLVDSGLHSEPSERTTWEETVAYDHLFLNTSSVALDLTHILYQPTETRPEPRSVALVRISFPVLSDEVLEVSFDGSVYELSGDAGEEGEAKKLFNAICKGWSNRRRSEAPMELSEKEAFAAIRKMIACAKRMAKKSEVAAA